MWPLSSGSGQCKERKLELPAETRQLTGPVKQAGRGTRVCDGGNIGPSKAPADLGPMGG